MPASGQTLVHLFWKKYPLLVTLQKKTCAAGDVRLAGSRQQTDYVYVFWWKINGSERDCQLSVVTTCRWRRCSFFSSINNSSRRIESACCDCELWLYIRALTGRVTPWSSMSALRSPMSCGPVAGIFDDFLRESWAAFFRRSVPSLRPFACVCACQSRQGAVQRRMKPNEYRPNGRSKKRFTQWANASDCASIDCKSLKIGSGALLNSADSFMSRYMAMYWLTDSLINPMTCRTAMKSVC